MDKHKDKKTFQKSNWIEMNTPEKNQKFVSEYCKKYYKTTSLMWRVITLIREDPRQQSKRNRSFRLVQEQYASQPVKKGKRKNSNGEIRCRELNRWGKDVQMVRLGCPMSNQQN
ncbi:hypothetical protein Y032_0210g2157 [Ancylostoma ceylanicum]|uniref:Uncharacterized protein n=1 Tax=Ancylostoma ceylanicum TaxID=53326 RepID=A0A016SLD0_9BILA|nr:hypothetical protein Y032_0210g2157 [Ancylostoma ceylanicum]